MALIDPIDLPARFVIAEPGHFEQFVLQRLSVVGDLQARLDDAFSVMGDLASQDPLPRAEADLSAMAEAVDALAGLIDTSDLLGLVDIADGLGGELADQAGHPLPGVSTGAQAAGADRAGATVVIERIRARATLLATARPPQ
jgi:hypothetical protein